MDFIDINKVKIGLETFLNNRNFDQYIKVFLLKVDKNDVTLYKQEANKTTKEVLLKSMLESMEQTTFCNREIKEYDPVVTSKNVHEQVSVSSYDNIQAMIDKFNDESKHLVNTSSETEKTLHHYMITIENNSGINVKFIGSFVNIFQLKKKFLIGNFTDSEIRLNNANNMIGFNKKIDLLVVNDEEILINQAESKFDSIFRMNAKFAEQATYYLNNDQGIQQIFSVDAVTYLKNKVLSGKRIATRLNKIVSDRARFQKTVENIHKIQTILDDPEHTFHKKISDVRLENGKLTIDDESKCDQIINAISDAFVKAFISEVETVEEGRM